MKVTDFLLLSCQSHLAEDLTQQLFIVLLQAFLRTLATTDWYKADFNSGTSNIDLLAFLSKYSTVKIGKNASVEFMEYDWNLNE